MSQAVYVSIAADYAQRIRSGSLPPGVQLPSYSDIEAEYGKSKAVVRQAMQLLQSLGLVRAIERRGLFVVDDPTLVRVSPERQMETAEETYGHEAPGVVVERDTSEVTADDKLAHMLEVGPGIVVTHTAARASKNRQGVSISDTYQPLEFEGISQAAFLKERLTEDLPSREHARWLGVSEGELVKYVEQTFTSREGKVVMFSRVAYPRHRYEAFVFHMVMNRD